MRTSVLAEFGRAEQALAEQAGPLAERLEAAGDIVLRHEPARCELRLLVERERGHGRRRRRRQLADSVRGTGVPETVIVGFTGAVQRLLAHGQPEQAKALLVELDQFRRPEPTPTTPRPRPELVRTRSPSETRSSRLGSSTAPSH